MKKIIIKKEEKKAISQVVATILLITVVIILAAIILFAFRSVIKEQKTKFNKAIEVVCQDIDLDVQTEVQVENGVARIPITNQGNIPVYKLQINKKTWGASQLLKYTEESFESGASKIVEVEVSDEVETLEIIPILLSQSGTAKKEHACIDQTITVTLVR